MKGAIYEIPVVSIRIVPISGTNVDEAAAGMKSSATALNYRINRLEANLKYSVEEASRFHGYKDAKALPALGVKLLKIYTFYERAKPFIEKDGKSRFPDYGHYLKQVGIQDLVEKQGVKEVWFWHYHHGSIAPQESMMAGAAGEDVSNSYHLEGLLSNFKKTYTVYGFNFARSFSQAMHNRGHQIERILSHAESISGKGLFTRDFVGAGKDGKFVQGRAGNCHFPPNGRKDYDYHNQKFVQSDIEDWTPSGKGAKRAINCDTWKRLPYQYPFPKAGNPELYEDDENWYIYWMQNMPNEGNTLGLSNWLAFFGDWDGMRDRKIGLLAKSRS